METKLEPLLLTIDFGTQSVRTSVYNKQGEVLAQEKEKYQPPYFSLLPNYAEQDPHLYYESLCRCLKRLTSVNASLMPNLKALTLTCFRDSAVILDKDNKVIRPTILWIDQRTAECKKPLPWYHRFMFWIVGMGNTVTFNRQRSVANWIQENEPENWAKTNKYISISTYFNWLLTGSMRDSASNYAGHYPINFRHRAWYKNPEKHFKGQIFGIKASMLPELVKEGDLIGNINEAAASETGLPIGLPLYATGSDKSCETLGLGVLDDQTAAISYGTASTVETTRTKYTSSEPFLPGYSSCIPGYYNMDIQVYRGYWMINWFLKEFGGKEVNDIIISDVSADDFNRKLSLVPPGSDGLVLQPYWGPGLARPLAKGAIIGFSDSITQEHFYRAIIEGIAYALREGLEHFEKKIHHYIPRIRIAGGGSQSSEICQITADIMGREVQRVQTCETSSLGAAIAGFLAIGEFKTPKEAVEAMVHPQDVFKPDETAHRKYDYLYTRAYEKMYPRLKGIYRDIKNYNKEMEKEARFEKFFGK